MNEKETQTNKTFKNCLYLLLAVIVSSTLSCKKNNTPTPVPSPPAATAQLVYKNIMFTFMPHGYVNDAWIRIDWNGDNNTDTTITMSKVMQPSYNIVKNVAVPCTLKAQWFISTPDNYTYEVEYLPESRIESKILTPNVNNYSIEVLIQ